MRLSQTKEFSGPEIPTNGMGYFPRETCGNMERPDLHNWQSGSRSFFQEKDNDAMEVLTPIHIAKFCSARL